MNKTEKLNLYKQAKEAYYNGQEIMTDYEFDQLEKELGLENKSEVGARHNPSYTIQHPFMMGSLSKVQIHKDKDGVIDWTKYYNEVLKYVGLDCNLIITPKYDGCSFECEIKDHKILQISSRGDGECGKDLTNHLYNHIPQLLIDEEGHNVFRGEVLVKKSIFEKKYSEKFTNPRSFVSGALNRDYEDTPEMNEMLNDLSIVVYDVRSIDNGKVTDYDWTDITFANAGEDLSFFPDFYEDTYFGEMTGNAFEDFENIYNRFANYRHNCEYALDGFVIKPAAEFREPSTDERRPKDCVAIKFIPMLEETEVVDITWNLGKTHEYTPIIWVKPVEMDGRMVQKCSGHNLGYLREKGITIGAKIIMSLAGDIIPFMYKVTQENPNGEIPMPTDYGYEEDGIHLMAMVSEEDRIKMQFINSVNALNIPTVGGQTAKEIYEYISHQDETTADFFGEPTTTYKKYFNILLCSPEDIYFGCGAGKAGDNARKAFKKILKTLTLNDIIKSCNFKLCGGKVTEAVVDYLLAGKANWEHLATEGYLWVYDNNSRQWREINAILEHLGKTIEDFKVVHEEAAKVATDQIPVILTGEPTNYKSKGEFMQLNPQYRQTTSWKEVQIVFTNSLDSNTGKMKNARAKGIKIELY